MGIYDRDYSRPGGYQQQYSMGGGFRGLPPVVKWLLIINFAVFMIGALVFPPLKDHPLGMNFIESHFAVHPATTGMALQIWRLISYQFLHANVFHLVFNLMVLYFMGPFAERAWGSRAFLKFYLIAGAVGGFVYTLLVLLHILPLEPNQPILPMVGASGAIYGVVAAIAVMYPRMKVLVWGIIPMTMVWLVILIVILSLLNIASGKNTGGEAAHLTGLAVGFLYVTFKPWLTRFRMERSRGAWTQKMQQQQRFQQEVDRILEKVHREGINSLSEREKNILREATQREQQ